MRGQYLVAAALALAFASPSFAGSIKDDICTDRPGKGSAPCAAPKGHWQFETGLADWSVTKSKGTRSTDLSLGQTSIKYGLTDHLHVEVEFTPLVRKTSRSATSRSHDSGFGDIKIKAKQELTANGADFSATFYAYVKIPTASKKMSNGKIEGGLIVPLGLSFGKSPWSLSASPEIDASLDGDGHGYHPTMAQSLSLNLQATRALSFSAELWGSWDWDPANTTRQASIDGTVAYKINRDFQIDGEIDLGLNNQTADVEFSGGLSMRF